jgi:hypothetical protein
MPKGPKGEKRPADVISNAVKVMKIAIGEEVEDEGHVDDQKDKAAVSMGKRGGKARANKLSSEQKSAIASNAAKKRWSSSSDK